MTIPAMAPPPSFPLFEEVKMASSSFEGYEEGEEVEEGDGIDEGEQTGVFILVGPAELTGLSNILVGKLVGACVLRNGVLEGLLEGA